MCFHNLLDYGNGYIEKLSVKEDMARNTLLAIDSFIHEKVMLREEYDILEEGKELHILKIIRRRKHTPITQMSDEIFNRDFKIDELNKKIERFSNDVSNIKRHKY